MPLQSVQLSLTTLAATIIGLSILSSHMLSQFVKFPNLITVEHGIIWGIRAASIACLFGIWTPAYTWVVPTSQVFAALFAQGLVHYTFRFAKYHTYRFIQYVTMALAIGTAALATFL